MDKQSKSSAISSMFPEDYTIINFQTTDLRVKDTDLLELSAIKFRNLRKINQLSIVIKHGDSVADALKQFLAFIGQDIIIVYYAPFHIEIFRYRLNEFCDITLKNKYIDTFEIGKTVFQNLENHKLSTVIESMNLIVEGKLESQKQCFRVQKVYEVERKFWKEHGSESLIKDHKQVDFRKLSADDDSGCNQDSVLRSKHVCVSGKLTLFEGKKDALQCVVNRGGYAENGVTKNLDYLVVPDVDYEQAKAGKGSGKVKKAYEYHLNKEGNVRIISESKLCELLKS